MFVSTAIAALNHLLATAPWARARLAPFAGRSAEIAVSPVRLALGIDSDGYFCETVAAEHDVRLELPLASLPKAAGGVDALMGDIRIAGNAEFADALGFVLRKLRWDGEEALSHLIGDIAAHRATLTLGEVFRWQQHSARNLVENLAEYFTEERPVLVKHASFERFAADAAALRDDLARLDKRIARIKP
jgi:ubiquinone biosynthesis protein UbiJ